MEHMMCRRLLQLNALRTFEVAARHRSLARAAEELAVTPAAIHHHVKLLEENFGVSLFIRCGNNLELTQAAAAVLPTLEGAFDLLSLATEQLKQHAAGGVLSVATCPGFGLKWLIPRLTRFKSDFPQIELRLSNIDQLPDLANSEIDLAVFYSDAEVVDQEGAVIELLLRDTAYPICAPEFQRREGLKCEEDLKASHLLQDNQLLHSRQLSWSMWLSEESPRQLRDALQLDSTILAIEAAIAGSGVALAPHSLVQHDISTNRLVRLFSRSLALPGGYYLAHLQSVGEQPMVVAFREWLFAEANVNRALFVARRNERPHTPTDHKEVVHRRKERHHRRRSAATPIHH
jgi:LysR family glycine cleavage system transcriptional activator